jgi:hypothetical protein
MEDATAGNSATGQPATATGQSGKGYLVASVIIALISAFASLGAAIVTNNSKNTAQTQLESYQQQQQRQQQAFQQQQQEQQQASQREQSRLSACKNVAVALGRTISDIDSVIIQDTPAGLEAAARAISGVTSDIAYAKSLGARLNKDLVPRLNDIDNNVLDNVPLDIGALRDRRSALYDDENNNLCS